MSGGVRPIGMCEAEESFFDDEVPRGGGVIGWSSDMVGGAGGGCTAGKRYPSPQSSRKKSRTAML